MKQSFEYLSKYDIGFLVYNLTGEGRCCNTTPSRDEYAERARAALANFDVVEFTAVYAFDHVIV